MCLQYFHNISKNFPIYFHNIANLKNSSSMFTFRPSVVTIVTSKLFSTLMV